MTPQEVFERDVKGVKECDILVAEISEPSHDVGMEIMLAYLQEKKDNLPIHEGGIYILYDSRPPRNSSNRVYI